MENGEIGYAKVTATSTSASLTLPARCMTVMVINDGPVEARIRLFDNSGTPAAADASSLLVLAGESMPFNYQRSAGVNSLGFWRTLVYWSAGTANLRVISQ
jgi:hypothetical protein